MAPGNNGAGGLWAVRGGARLGGFGVTRGGGSGQPHRGSWGRCTVEVGGGLGGWRGVEWEKAHD